jgi:phosphoribosylanthranilate isomerase
MVKIKICGLRRLEDIEIVNRYDPDYIGFVFADSKRQVSHELASHLKLI